MLKFTAPVIRTVALAAALGSFGFAAHAQTDSTDTTPTISQAPADKSMKHDMPHHGMMNVEKRISTLHDKLKITADEESEWATVAQTMRDNEAKIDELVQARHADPESMTAIDDMESYQKIVQAHADGLQNMAASFKALYEKMPEDQQKNADMVFGSFEGHGGPAAKHSKKHSS